jgi:hypothetical protein
MAYYADFDLHLNRERNRELVQEVQILRLEKRLRAALERRSSWCGALVERAKLVVRKAGLAGMFTPGREAEY